MRKPIRSGMQSSRFLVAMKPGYRGVNGTRWRALSANRRGRAGWDDAGSIGATRCRRAGTIQQISRMGMGMTTGTKPAWDDPWIKKGMTAQLRQRRQRLDAGEGAIGWKLG